MTYQDYGIQIPNGKYTGEITAICPQCSHNRKPEHQKIKCLGVNLDKKVWRCNHCGWTGGLPDSNYIPPETKIYKKPIWTNKTELSEGIVKWFEKRKISQKTLLKLKITQNKVYLPQLKEEVNCMQFNYFRNGELINIKSRDHKKNFALESGAELIFYNLDSIIGAKEIYITEGEIDTITLEECGIVRPGVGVISVPNGANLNTNNLKYIDNCIELFDTIEKIHLAVDDDIAGRKLREDLAERFGKERCDYIEYNGKKDLNEVLIAGEIQDVIACCSNKKEFPIIGISTVSTYNNDIDDMYINGMDRGVPLKMGKIDNLIRFVTGYITVITGIPNHGKALCINTDIPTVNGWKKMANIQVGDVIFDENGLPATVTMATEIMFNRPCYKLTFNDGTEIIADEQHKWLTDDWKSRRSANNKKIRDKKNKTKKIQSNGIDQSYKRTYPSVKNTLDIFNTLKVKKDNRNNHSILLCKPVMYPKRDLLINPYVLGAWLGDGNSYGSGFSCGDTEIIRNIQKHGYIVNKWNGKYEYGIIGLITQLKKINVLKNKHIPCDYLKGSYNQRLSLLQGLMDTDGSIDKTGICEFCNINKQLIGDVYELITSLGIKAKIINDKAKLYGKIISDRYRIIFSTILPVFCLNRKKQRLPKKIHTNKRFIINCEKTESVPVKCISVNSPSHLFLCTKSFIATHNSDWLDQMVLKLMVNHGWKVGYYSPENKPTKLHFSKLARKLIGKNWFGKNRMSEKEKDLCKNYLEDKVYFIKLEKDFTLNSLLDRVKQLKMRRGINCFVIDAWNRLEHKHDGKNETKYVNESLLKLDAFCEYYNIHCFLVAHPTKIEKDKKTQQYLVPTLYNISGSAHFYNIVANGITVYRDFVHNVTKVFIQKVKFSHWGEIGTVEYRYDKECGRYNECNVRDEEGKLDINFKFLEDKGNWITGDNKQEILPMDGFTTNNTEDPPF